MRPESGFLGSPQAAQNDAWAPLAFAGTRIGHGQNRFTEAVSRRPGGSGCLTAGDPSGSHRQSKRISLARALLPALEQLLLDSASLRYATQTKSQKNRFVIVTIRNRELVFAVGWKVRC